MGQVLHIFRKDTRRFWPEILVSLAVLLAFVLVEPKLWPLDQAARQQGGLQAFSGFLQFLIPVTWWLLLARVVQAEGLVGDTQAWLTRPYEWTKLLAAKGLFCLAYVCLPILIVQFLLLRLAGFAPQMFIGGVAHNAVWVAAFVVLPLFAVAALTENFARMTLTLLGLVLAMIALVALIAWTHTNVIMLPDQPSHWEWLRWAWMGLLVFTIMLQYARRRTWFARGMLVLPVVLGLLLTAAYVPRPNIDAAYPQEAETGLQVVFSPGKDNKVRAYVQTGNDGSMIHVELPVSTSGLHEGSAAELDVAKVTLDGPGVHWVSDWQRSYQRFVPGTETSSLGFAVKREVYEKLRGHPADLHVVLGLSRLTQTDTSESIMDTRDFRVPQNGICALNPKSDRIGPHCRFALHQPTRTYETAPASLDSCDGAAAEPQLTGSSWISGFSAGDSAFGLTPIALHNDYFSFERKDGQSSDMASARLCPGTKLTSKQYRFAARTRADFAVQSLVLPQIRGE